MPYGEASAIEGKLKVWLTVDKVWACSKCKTHLASHDDIKLKRYPGFYGTAYLFKKVVNIKLPGDDLRTISHEPGGYAKTVEARCMGCDLDVGQKFLEVPKEVKFKKNKVLLERQRIVKEWQS